MFYVFNMVNNLDVFIFVFFLKEVEFFYEVYDYIRVYLGDIFEVKEFVK